MKAKWSVEFYYPVKKNNKVAYTTRKIFKFNKTTVAKLFYWAVKIFCKTRKKYYSCHISYIPKFHVDEYLDFSESYMGQWIGYNVCAEGDNIKELKKSCIISTIDQDGGELYCGGLYCESIEELARKEAIDLLHNTILMNTDMGSILYEKEGYNND